MNKLFAFILLLLIGGVAVAQNHTTIYLNTKPKIVNNLPEKLWSCGSGGWEITDNLTRNIKDTIIVVQQQPHFKGGNNALKAFIHQNLKIPSYLACTQICGTSYIQFWVQATGKLTDIKILHGFDKECDLAALDLVKKMPNWIPAKHHGRAVRTRHTLPIYFSASAASHVPQKRKTNLVKNKTSDCDCSTAAPNDSIVQVTDNHIYNSATIKPSFPGGYDSLASFIKKNMVMPDDAICNEVSGGILVDFVVHKTGKILNIKLHGRLGFGCDQEAIRLVKLMPKWIPAQHNGQAINYKYVLDIDFPLTAPNFKHRSGKSWETICQEINAKKALVGDIGDSGIHCSVEQKPRFKGGDTALQAFIKKNMVMPELAYKKPIDDTILVQFVVRKTGELTNFFVPYGSFECAEEALRLVKLMPKWIPAQIQHKVVNTQYTLPIHFKTEQLKMPKVARPRPVFYVSAYDFDFNYKNKQYPFFTTNLKDIYVPEYQEGIKSSNISPDEPPRFIGGQDCLNTYLREKISTLNPEFCQKAYVEFIVEKTGKLSSVHLVQNIGFEYDNKITQIILAMPDWIPARHQGQAVHCRYVLPIDLIPSAPPDKISRQTKKFK
ncbi:TonB protein C-terminal [Flexibacter flexilis DSM 6793]|uniref:TonB protein C-terminal n=1 Tax=Flexibacter flexilis DSM 6793 TaxID=927664 RepID=A0A1I1DX23_9BACT|nr:energy transducer TonB [Flexibacter flexilis]SFB77260.1 TonB protein C-terminal [Flexibacter flexilis DSM 6793]